MAGVLFVCISHVYVLSRGLKVEGLSDLINAETSQQRLQALRHLGGETQRLYVDWRRKLVACIANIEAFIDFGEDENIEDGVVAESLTQLTLLRKEIASHLDDNRSGERLRNGVRLAIVGAPDVGKSSLLNRLSRREAAIVSAGPGTTRDVVQVRFSSCWKRPKRLEMYRGGEQRLNFPGSVPSHCTYCMFPLG